MEFDKILVFIFVGILSSFLTWKIRCYALKHSILDIPSNRSSHSFPVPRGAGLGISACCLLAILFFGVSGDLEPRLMWAFLGGGTVVTIMGWIDDRSSVPPLWRLLTHLLAAIWVVFLMRGFPSIHMGFGSIYLGCLGSILSVIGIVWFTNLYNFMDGIDGLAGAEAVTVGIMGGVLLTMSKTWGLASVSWIIAAASLGFLIWNWPPAKIFMGDAGSGFLGFSFAVLLLASERSNAVPVMIWLLLLGVFVGDSSFTLLRRLFKREKIWEAHRSHFYQRAVQTGLSHEKVTMAVIGINGLLFGFSLFALIRPFFLLLALSAGLSVLFFFAKYVHRCERNFRESS